MHLKSGTTRFTFFKLENEKGWEPLSHVQWTIDTNRRIGFNSNCQLPLSSPREDRTLRTRMAVRIPREQTCKLEKTCKVSAHPKVISWQVSVKLHANSIFSVMIYSAEAALSWWYRVFNKDRGLVESQSAMHRWFTFTFGSYQLFHMEKYNKAALRKKLAVITKDALGKKWLYPCMSENWICFL